MRRSISTRLLVTFIALATIPLMLVGIVLAWQTFTTQQQQALQAEHLKASGVATQMRDFISNLENELHMLIQIRGLTSLSYEEQSNALSEILSYENGFEDLALLDTKGQELTRVTRTGIVRRTDLADRSTTEEFLSPTSTGKTYFSSVQVASETGEPFMTVSEPIINLRSGQNDGVLVANVRFKPIWDMVARINTGENDTNYILDAQGQVVAHPDPSVVLSRTHFDVVAQNGIQQGLSGASVILSTDKVQLGNQQFTVVAEQPATDALALAINAVVVTGIVILAALALAGVSGFFAVRLIVRPIRSLATTVQAIMAGDLSQEVAIKAQDEIGNLATAFNSMTAQLRRTMEGLRQNVNDLKNTQMELEVANAALRESEASLEKRVTDRTRDLQIAADVSRQITTILDLDQLLSVVVERTKAAFSLYHTSIFLYGAEANKLVLRAGTGKAGEAMKAEGWSFRMSDQGLVPQSTRQRSAVAINDTASETLFRPNPHLPQTRSELALPMFIGDKLIGVLDLQSEHLNRFSADDIRVVTTLAEQIAIAVNNANLYAEQIQVADQLRSVDKMKSQFLASMSHELRTPLNAILNFTEFVAVGMLGPVNDQQVDALNKALDSGNHLLALINDVLDMTKIESGSMKLFIEPHIDLRAELEPVISTAQSLLNGKPVTLIEDIDPDLPRITGDRRRIRQILLNLISNAVKFTEEGSITLRAKNQQHEVLFAVVDTGPGIALEDQERIFEPFVQTETGLIHAGGTGLGLPISRRLTEAHGGRLWMESTLGAGAAFYVVIPVNNHESPETAQGETYAQ